MTRTTYEAFGPSGRMETTASSKREAERNFRYRLIRDCGLSKFKAREYDLEPIRPVQR